MTRFVSNDELWRELQTRVSNGKRVRAAIAYFGGRGAKLLPLKKGDSIVVDLSLGAVRQGITNPHELRTLAGRGVKVFSRGSLHAKFLLIDKTLIASSANASRNSKEVLDEAGIITTDPAAVRRATVFFDKLCTEPVGPEYLKTCIAEYRPPKFKPAIERRQPRSKGSRRVVEAKLWFIGGLVVLNLTDDARESIERLEHRYEK
jgi:phosphatidylserine/phosphatidylglycerophosphate/cardiolipin synthase-like enzyme